jgi:transcription termination factor Rho
MSKAKAKADASATASTATLDAPAEIKETAVKKRAPRRTAASASAAVAEVPEALPTLPPAPATRTRKKAAPAAEAPATPAPAPVAVAEPAPTPVKATRTRKAAAPAPAPAPEPVAVAPAPAPVPEAKPVRAPRKKAATPTSDVEQLPLILGDTPVRPAPAPAPKPAPAAPVAEVRAEPAPRPRRPDPEEEIAEAIAAARKAQAEAAALEAEARAKAAEAKAREAEIRLRQLEARARTSGIDPFADMDGESVIEKAPPMPGPGQPRDYRDRDRDRDHRDRDHRDHRDRDRDRGPQQGQGPRNYQDGPRDRGQQGGQGGPGGQGQGGQGQHNRPNRSEPVFQGHTGKPGKRDKFEWKKNKNNRNNKQQPWQQRGPEGQPARYGGAPAQPGAEGEADVWRPGGENAPEFIDGEFEAHEEGATLEGQPRAERPERPERPPMEERPARDPEYGEGIIEISGKGKGFGFLRESVRNYAQSPADVFVTPEIIRKYNLKDGMKIYGETRRGNRGPQLYKLIHINGENPEKYRKAPAFEELTVINPMERIRLETVPERYTTRVMDMMTPVGKGQRGLIVSPPRSGKTTMLQHIAEAITINYPDMPLILMLIDERPEEVTELRRALPKAEVIASSNDSDPRAHLRTAQLGIERAKRLVEGGHDVFMLLDSITRMARAFNNAMHGGGKTGSGGIDLKAMEIPRKIFASARNTEEAGSLTIIATALVDTGSKGDEYIFQEFKGTGNMEVVLDRKISDQLIFPAIDIFQSGTRREELILPPFMLDKINTIRRGLAGTKSIDAISRLLMFLRRFPTNFELLNEIPG